MSPGWLQDRMVKLSVQSQKTAPDLWDLLSLQKDWDSSVQIASQVNLEVLGYKSGAKLLYRGALPNSLCSCKPLQIG